MDADLDLLLTTVFVTADDLLPARQNNAARSVTDAEVVTLCVAQAIMGIPSDRRFLAVAEKRLAHLFPRLPKQPGYFKRRRKLADTLEWLMGMFASESPGFYDDLLLIDSTPVECARSRETVKRSQLADAADYGYCGSHSRFFWGFRLYLLCASDGMPICFELAPANAPERAVAAEMLERVDLDGYTVLADKGFVGAEFEQIMASLGARFLRPDRKDEPHRNGSLGPIRQWIESTFWTCKGQLALERHGGRTLPGVCVRIALRLLALAAGLAHNQTIGDPGRHFAAYTH